MNKSTQLLSTILAFSSCALAPTMPVDTLGKNAPVRNVAAFARLFGVVKYFHPTDEAASVNWNDFAVYGAREVTDARDDADLARRLQNLFLPIAPTIEISRGDEPHEALEAPRPRGGELIAWQHLGDGIDSPSYLYRSARIGRDSSPDQALPGCIKQDFPAEVARGKQIRVRAWLRNGAGHRPSNPRIVAKAIVWPLEKAVSYVGPETQLTSEWNQATFLRTVPENATKLSIGVCEFGDGQVLVDDIDLAVQDNEAWRQLAVNNSGFEVDTAGSGWSADTTGYRVGVVEEGAHGGKRAVRIEREEGLLRGALFRQHASEGEIEMVDLGNGLRARVPLTVWSQGEHTIPAGDLPKVQAAMQRSKMPGSDKGCDRAAAVVVAWNAIQHFHPYLDTQSLDWQQALEKGLEGALKSPPPPLDTVLSEMIEPLQDGHATIAGPAQRPMNGYLPVVFDWIENRLIVTASLIADVRPGDEIIEIEHDVVSKWMERKMRLVSGSPQWKRQRVMTELIYGAIDSVLEIKVAHDSGAAESVRLMRGSRPPSEHPGKSVREVAEGTMYVDLTMAEASDIDENLPALTRARSVVFDLRGYPNTHKFLDNLVTDAEDRKWMFVAHQIYPNRQRITEWTEIGWNLRPAHPHIKGKVAILVNARAISYAESIIGYFDGLHLGRIVGSASAGANASIAMMALPGGYTLTWGGMKVQKHDGSKLHGHGFEPTDPIAPTVKGVRAGRDEVLEQAIALLQSGK